jgi:hypothetical protein
MLFSSLVYGLLATSALAAPARFDARKRDFVVEDVVITEAISVLEQADGSYVTQDAVAVGTAIDRTTVKETVTPTPTPTPTPTSTHTSTSKPTTSTSISPPKVALAPSSQAAKVVVPSPAVMQQSSSSSSTPVAPAPVPTTPAVPSVEPSVAPIISIPSITLPTLPITFATSTSSSAAASPTTPSGGSGAKRGLAYNEASFLSAFTGSLSNWCYNWGSTPGGDVPSNLEYVPMLWSDTDSFTGDWDSAVSTAKSSGSSHLLSFNEPDLSSQSNIAFGQAASSYMTYMQPYAGSFKLGAPAVTNGDAASGMGLGYLSSFISSCKDLGCTIDFVPIHWYNDASQVEDFKNHVTQAHTAGGNRPVWITEIGASGSTDAQQSFLEEVIPWLDSQDFVERYAYFMVSDGSLMSGSSVSALGKTYAFASS